MFGLQTLVLLWRFHPTINTAPRWEPNRSRTRDMRLNTKFSRSMFLLLCSFYLNSYLSFSTSILYDWIELVYGSSWVKDHSNLLIFPKQQTSFSISACVSCVYTNTFKWWYIHQLRSILLKSRRIGPLNLISSVRYCCFGIYLFLSVIKFTVLIKISNCILKCVAKIITINIQLSNGIRRA